MLNDVKRVLDICSTFLSTRPLAIRLLRIGTIKSSTQKLRASQVLQFFCVVASMIIQPLLT
jgi:hypothetical protein